MRRDTRFFLQLLILAGVGCATLACSRRSHNERTAGPIEGSSEQKAPNVAPEVVLLRGAEIIAHGKKLGGKGFLLNVWASWCGPCKEEFPMLVRLQESYRKQGVPIVFVSVDTPESRDVAVSFARGQGFEGSVLFADGPLSETKAALHPGWPGMLPSSFLYDASGKLRYFWGGPAYESELSPIVEKLARGENVQGETRFDVVPGAHAP